MPLLVALAFSVLCLPSGTEVTVLVKADVSLAEQVKEEAREFVATEVKKFVQDRLLERRVSTPSITVTILKIDQKNRSSGEVLSNPNGPGSMTKVEVTLESDGSSFAGKGQAKGPYFGTTDRAEMGGGPKEKSKFIQLINRQRARSIALAAWNAIQDRFPAQRR